MKFDTYEWLCRDCIFRPHNEAEELIKFGILQQNKKAGIKV